MTKIKITAVIPTLGNQSLIETIDSLNSGSLIPDEIIVCMPKERDFKTVFNKNVLFIYTNYCGQVAQRVRALKEVTGELVLQLDDDIILDKRCLEFLVNSMLALNINAAISPALICKDTSISIYKPPNNSLKRKIYYWLLNGKKGFFPGAITKAGTNIGVGKIMESENLITVDWLPGGCVLHRKKSLILKNYYPFIGKAYCEDLIHSHLLIQSGIKLIVANEAKAYVDKPILISTFTFKDFYNYLKKDYNARSYFIRISNRSFLRMNVYYVIKIIKYIFKWNFKC